MSTAPATVPAPPPAAPAAPPPLAAKYGAAPAGHVNILVDGKHAVVPATSNLIEAAKTVGVEIPYFCYHPRLSIAGQCRMCLVETADARGRLVAGCHVRVRENLEIITNSPLVRDGQRSSMESHLVNHPVDCPICDQSGECKLQDYYMAYDGQASRIATNKVNKPKRKVFGPVVVYDAERCILCTRCVRFMNEVAESPQLAMVGRGDHSEIDIIGGAPLDSKYSGNTVDICPVGALLNRDFRFQSRVWYLDSTRTVCDGCSNGCNMSADTRADAVYRLLPKRNEEVNQVWLCDDGRASYHRTMDARLETARSGRGDAGDAPTHEAAIEDVANILRPLAKSKDLGVAISATLSTEEIFAAATFAKEFLGVSTVFATGRTAGAGDDFLIREDKNPNSKALEIITKALGLELKGWEDLSNSIEFHETHHAVFFGGEVPGDAAKAADTIGKLQTAVMFGATKGRVSDAATYVLPLATHLEQEGTFINYYGRLQRFHATIAPRFDAHALWSWVSKIWQTIGAGKQCGTAQEAFACAAEAVAPLAGLALDTLPDTGLVLPGLNLVQFKKRAPRPAATATASA